MAARGVRSMRSPACLHLPINVISPPIAARSTPLGALTEGQQLSACRTNACVVRAAMGTARKETPAGHRPDGR
jgi:hypothetical protein